MPDQSPYSESPSNQHYRRGDIFRLNSDTVVVITEDPIAAHHGVSCMIIGGLNPVYKPGAWDTHVSFTGLDKAKRINIT